MSKDTITESGINDETDSWSSLEIVLREGARKMLRQALEIEIEEYFQKHSQTDENGHRLVVRNGYHPEREILTGIGPLTVRALRGDNRKADPNRENP